MIDDYDPSVRLAPPPGDESPLSAIEITFAIPSYVTHEQWQRIREVVIEITEAPCNTPQEGLHWLSSEGCKPRWSQYDAAFMGKPVDPSAPEEGEPTFDHTIHVMETAARGFGSEEERSHKLRKRAP